VPIVALGAAIVPAAITGSVLVERLFALPGTGRLLADAVFSRDVPTVLGLTLVVALAVVGASVASDLAAGWLDPRTREESGG
jgi:peptide/nickel transport system permease protein